ncbi:MAG: uroporphyrinogen-III C-methyltransferase [Pseudomonadota bacterium]
MSETDSAGAGRSGLWHDMARMPEFAPGSVWLVGAGPGDPGLLTLRAARALGEADVVVHDALIDDRVLELVGPGARLMFAGKRGGQPSVKQDTITGWLIEEARAGRRVLRLKGGDPFIFGRGGEEARALAAAQIPFHVVPGVTSALAGLAEAGIPATMRGSNRALVLATGHSLQAGTAAIDWEALARLDQPVMLYMAMRYLPEICERLIAGGMDPSTPAALLTSISMQERALVITDLRHLGEESLRFRAPAIAVIGRIVAERDALAGFMTLAPPPDPGPALP